MFALGGAYGLKVVADERLAKERDIHFESGDHESLARIGGSNFRKRAAEAPQGRFTELM